MRGDLAEDRQLRLGGQLLRELGDVGGVVTHPLQLGGRVVEGQQLPDVARHGALAGDHAGDLQVDLALQLVDLGVGPAHLVCQVDVALHHGLAGALKLAFDHGAQPQDVVLGGLQLVFEGAAERRVAGVDRVGRRRWRALCLVFCRALHGLLPQVSQPNRPVM